MSNYIVKEGETITDVVINSTGSIDNYDIILEANSFNDWTPSLYAGQSIVIPDTVTIQSNILSIMANYPVCNNINTDVTSQIDTIIGIFANVVIYDDVDIVRVLFDNDSNQALYN